MNLLSLNDDVLVHIFSFLYGRDALHISLASRRAHDLAISRVPSAAVCRSPYHVTRIHEYMLGPAAGSSGPRARYLHMLNIPYVAFNLWYSQIPDPACVEDYYTAADEGFALDTSMAKLVDEVLLQAVNLRSLSIDMLSVCVEEDPRVSEALSSMTQLTDLRMWLVADSILGTIKSLPNSLSRVIFHCDHAIPGTITLPPLLLSLAVFTNLHSITLHDFKPPSPISPSTLPLLRSVRHLNLEQCWEDAIIIADCCPSLETLKFSLNRWPPQLTQSARRWPPLRRLTLADQLAGPIVHTGRVSTVHALELGDVFTVSDIPPLPAVVPNGFEDIFEHVRHALSLIRTTCPSALRAAIRVNETGFNGRLGAPRPTVLGDIAVAAPKLRVLDLVLKPVKIQKWRDILQGLHRELGSFKVLECLHVILPNVQSSNLQESDMDRAALVARFVGEVADTVPALKVLAVSRIKPEQWSPPEIDIVDGWDLPARMDEVIDEMWWRVLGVHGSKGVVRITSDEGERVRSGIVGILDSDLQTL